MSPLSGLLPTPPAGRLDVTVVIPAYQRADTVGRAVLSALLQSPAAPHEVLVVDDGSTDGTGDVAEALGARVLRQPNGGEGAARNAGLAAATTPWVAFLDSDDAWLPGHLAALRPAADGHVLVGALARAVPSGRLIGRPCTRPLPLSPREIAWPEVPVSPSASMVDRRTALDVGGFRALPRSADLDFWLRLLEHGTGLLLPEVTALYFEHAGQVSADAAAMRRSRLEVVAEHRRQPWCDERLLDAIRTASHWDDLRAAQREGRVGDALACARALVRTPGAGRALAQTLRHRAAVRSS